MTLRTWLAKAMAAGCGLLAATAMAQVRDAELKAAYIYNFALFTTWPDAGGNGGTGAATRAPLAVCVPADSPLWPGLAALNGKPVNGRPWTLTGLVHPKPVRCDLAVLARGAERPADLAGPVLVVRDGPGQGGAAITLLDDEEHVRFDIDTQEAARAGLRFSSRLLRLARNVQ